MSRTSERPPPLNKSANTPRVLLLVPDRPTGRTYARALERGTLDVEWVTSTAALDTRLSRGDLPAPALIMVLPAGRHHRARADLDPLALSKLVVRLAAGSGPDKNRPDSWRTHLREAFDAYCAQRQFSPRQRQVLTLYLSGSNDKEIADVCRCSQSTVYEHWRRMARKLAGNQKSDVVTDFHRFLAGNDVGPSGSA